MSHPFYEAVDADFRAVNDLVINSLSSHVPLVEEISHYLIDAGGKRLRPLLVLLSANACGYRGTDHIKLAAIIEFLHTAMLLHDDVVDASELRRGRKTVNASWGNPASVLVGDFLHSRAFEMMVEIGDMRVMEILSRATNTIAEGEVQQLTYVGNPDLTQEDYMQVITRKTAMLFQAASHAGAVLSGASEAEEAALRDYGLYLGLAFQLVDDVLDYEGDTEALGKNVGDDLAEGKVTLPLIATMRDGTPEQAEVIRSAIRERGARDLAIIAETVRESGGLAYTARESEAQVDKAIACLDVLQESTFKDAMNKLASFAVQRSF